MMMIMAKACNMVTSVHTRKTLGGCETLKVNLSYSISTLLLYRMTYLQSAKPNRAKSLCIENISTCIVSNFDQLQLIAETIH